jgi:hypothetical protein
MAAEPAPAPRCIVASVDARLAPQAFRAALREAGRRFDVAGVLVAAVLPPTLPIWAEPPGLRERAHALDVAARAEVPRHQVRVVRCRDAAPVLQAMSAGLDAGTVAIAGRSSWFLRLRLRAAGRDVVVLAVPRDAVYETPVRRRSQPLGQL